MYDNDLCNGGHLRLVSGMYVCTNHAHSWKAGIGRVWSLETRKFPAKGQMAG